LRSAAVSVGSATSPVGGAGEGATGARVPTPQPV